MKTNYIAIASLITAGVAATVTTFGVGLLANNPTNNTPNVSSLVGNVIHKTRDYKSDDGRTITLSADNVKCESDIREADTRKGIDTVAPAITSIVNFSQRVIIKCSMNGILTDLTGKKEHYSEVPQLCLDSGMKATTIGYEIDTERDIVSEYNGTKITPENARSWITFITRNLAFQSERQEIPYRTQRSIKDFMNHYEKNYNQTQVVYSSKVHSKIACTAARDFGLL